MSSAWAEVAAHSLIVPKHRLRSSELGDSSVKIGIRKDHRREIPSPSEWTRIKLLLERLERGEIPCDSITCSLLLTSCSDLRALTEGQRLHRLIRSRGLHNFDCFVENNLIQMYIRCSRIDLALEVFNSTPQQDAVAWTSLIAAFSRTGQTNEAILLFRRMLLVGVSPDRITFITIVSTIGELGSLQDARLVHCCIQESGLGSDTVVATAVLKMYSKCKSLEDARATFDSIDRHDRVSWTAMITALLENLQHREALLLFHRMLLEGVETSEITLASALGSCKTLRDGKMIHALASEIGVENEMVVGTALVTMYGECGEIEEASVMFNQMPERDVVLWTAMIGGYSSNGHWREAFRLFREMELSRVRPNRVTFLTLVNALSDKSALPEARALHTKIINQGLTDMVTMSAVVTMFGRCGGIVEARQVFESTGAKTSSVFAWNAIISVFANSGQEVEAVELVRRMQVEGVELDRVTFISLLSMFGHRGMVKPGCGWFTSISEDHMSVPSREHYSCVSDMLGRAGWLEEAEMLVRRMPWKPDDGIWVSLLGACRMYGDAERSERIAKKVLELQPGNSQAYVVLCNSLKTSST